MRNTPATIFVVLVALLCLQPGHAGCWIQPDASGHVTIPDGRTYIQADAFKDCTSLKSVIIPDSVGTMYNNIFLGCTNLTSVTLSKKPDFQMIRKGTFGGCTSLTSLTIPMNVRNIADDAFANSGLQFLDLPSSVTVLGESAFLNCANLTSVSLGSVQLIQRGTFQNCASLTNVTLPETVDYIQKYAFC